MARDGRFGGFSIRLGKRNRFWPPEPRRREFDPRRSGSRRSTTDRKGRATRATCADSLRGSPRSPPGGISKSWPGDWSNGYVLVQSGVTKGARRQFSRKFPESEVTANRLTVELYEALRCRSGQSYRRGIERLHTGKHCRLAPAAARNRIFRAALRRPRGDSYFGRLDGRQFAVAFAVLRPDGLRGRTRHRLRVLDPARRCSTLLVGGRRSQTRLPRRLVMVSSEGRETSSCAATRGVDDDQAGTAVDLGRFFVVAGDQVGLRRPSIAG